MVRVGVFHRLVEQVRRNARVEPRHVDQFVRALLVRRQLLNKQLEPLDEAATGEIALIMAHDELHPIRDQLRRFVCRVAAAGRALLRFLEVFKHRVPLAERVHFLGRERLRQQPFVVLELLGEPRELNLLGLAHGARARHLVGQHLGNGRPPPARRFSVVFHERRDLGCTLLRSVVAVQQLGRHVARIFFQQRADRAVVDLGRGALAGGPRGFLAPLASASTSAFPAAPPARSRRTQSAARGIAPARRRLLRLHAAARAGLSVPSGFRAELAKSLRM